MHEWTYPYKRKKKVLYGKREGAKLKYKEGGVTLPLIHINIGGKKKEASCNLLKLEETLKGKYIAHYRTDGINMLQLSFGAWVDEKERKGDPDHSLSEALQQDRLSRNAKKGILTEPTGILEVVKGLAIIALIIMIIGAFYMLNDTYQAVMHTQAQYQNQTKEMILQNQEIMNLTASYNASVHAEITYFKTH
jgi:hypothetical protein